MKNMMCFYALAIVMTLNGVAVTQEQEGSKEAETETHPRAGHLAIGFELTNFQTDFGLGLNLTSPYLHLLQHIPSEQERSDILCSRFSTCDGREILFAQFMHVSLLYQESTRDGVDLSLR